MRSNLLNSNKYLFYVIPFLIFLSSCKHEVKDEVFKMRIVKASANFCNSEIAPHHCRLWSSVDFVIRIYNNSNYILTLPINGSKDIFTSNFSLIIPFNNKNMTLRTDGEEYSVFLPPKSFKEITLHTSVLLDFLGIKNEEMFDDKITEGEFLKRIKSFIYKPKIVYYTNLKSEKFCVLENEKFYFVAFDCKYRNSVGCD